MVLNMGTRLAKEQYNYYQNDLEIFDLNVV